MREFPEHDMIDAPEDARCEAGELVEGRGHIVVVIKHDVDLDPALGAAEVGPREKTQAKGNGGRIERQELVLEAKLGFACAEAALSPEPVQGRPKQALVEGRGTVLVGVGQRRSFRGLALRACARSGRCRGETALDVRRLRKPRC